MTKREAKPTFYWLIEGYDSTKKIFSKKFKTTLIGQRQLEPLLKTLAAKAGLTLDEIVDCYLMKHTERYRPHLEVHRDINPEQLRMILTCGSNPHFVVRIVKE